MQSMLSAFSFVRPLYTEVSFPQEAEKSRLESQIDDIHMPELTFDRQTFNWSHFDQKNREWKRYGIEKYYTCRVKRERHMAEIGNQKFDWKKR